MLYAIAGLALGTIGLIGTHLWDSPSKYSEKSKRDAKARERRRRANEAREIHAEQRYYRRFVQGSEICMADTPFNTSGLCLACNHVRLKTLFLVRDEENEEMYVKWKYDYVTRHRGSKGCDFCSLLRRVIAFHEEQVGPVSGRGGWISIELRNSEKIKWPLGTATISTSGKDGFVKIIQPNGEFVLLSHTIFAARRTTPLDDKPLLSTSRKRVQIGEAAETVDFKVVREMIVDCLINHQGCTPKLINPPGFLRSQHEKKKIKDFLAFHQPKQMDAPFRLYDCRKECLITAPTGPNRLQKYIALSYVWGEDRGTEMENIKLMKKYEMTWQLPGTLPRRKFPKIIRDAVRITIKLGLQYLWVDKLCILQDPKDNTLVGIESAKEKDEAIAAMYWVYMNAYCTVVAPEAGHSLDPIPGISHSLRDRPQATVVAGRISLATAPIYVGETIIQSRWMARLWTFQEMICLPRTIFFTNSTVIYNCRKGCKREDTGTMVTIERYKSRMLQPITVFEEDIQPDKHLKTSNRMKYAKHLQGWIQQYISREPPGSEHPEDWELAFAGILSYVKPFLGESIFGNPCDIFHCSVAWHSDTLTLRRENFPSWSWTGWKYALGENDFQFHFAEPYLDFFSVEAQARSRNGLSITRSYGYTLVVERIGLKPTRSARPLQNFEVKDSKMISNIQKELRSKLEEIGTLNRPLLAFYTSIARLQLRSSEEVPRLRDSSGYGVGSNYLQTFDIWTRDSQRRLTTINLTRLQSRTNGQTEDFIVIQFQPRGFRLLMIEWENGIAYRVQLANGYVSVGTWRSVVESTSKLITMG